MTVRSSIFVVMGSALRVFLSYTSELAEKPDHWTWVDAAVEAIAGTGHAVRLMTAFGSDARRPADVCRDEVESCDVWVGLIGHRYGSVIAAEVRSYTEMEFDVATANGLHRFAYLLPEDAQVGWRADASVNTDRQAAFRERVKRTGGTVGSPVSPQKLFSDLAIKIGKPKDLWRPFILPPLRTQ